MMACIRISTSTPRKEVPRRNEVRATKNDCEEGACENEPLQVFPRRRMRSPSKIPFSWLRWIIFLLTSLLFVLSQFYRASVAVITPNLISDLGLDSEGLSLISAAFFYAFAVMQIPLGIYLDSLGARVTMTVLSLLAVAGALIFAWGESLEALVFGRILLGVGMACNLMGTLKLITLWFGPRRLPGSGGLPDGLSCLHGMHWSYCGLLCNDFRDVEAAARRKARRSRPRKVKPISAHVRAEPQSA